MRRRFTNSKKISNKNICYPADSQAADANVREGRVIFIGKEAIPLTEEVYQAYYKMDRHARYLEEDVKVGKTVTDPVTGEDNYKPSKEDSIERLIEKGRDFEDEQSVEDIVCDKAMLLLLTKAKEILDEEELKLINAVYDQELTYRQVGEMLSVSHVAVQKRHNKILDKLRKFFM